MTSRTTDPWITAHSHPGPPALASPVPLYTDSVQGEQPTSVSALMNLKPSGLEAERLVSVYSHREL